MIGFEFTKDVVKVSGDLTILHAAESSIRLRQALESGNLREVDLAGVEEIDTAGAQVLCWLKREACKRGVNLALTNHSQAVLEVLELLNLVGILGDTLVLPPAKGRR